MFQAAKHTLRGFFEDPLRPVCALGTSPTGGGKLGAGETDRHVRAAPFLAMTARPTWICHYQERSDVAIRIP